jgi:dihydroorotate dehydrogenase electron transfer subunit
MDEPVVRQSMKRSLPRGGYRILGWVTSSSTRGGMVRLKTAVPDWPGARPGQFALLHAEPSRCFLGRALSVSDEEGEEISFIVAPVGEGTRELCALKRGSAIWVLGPVGNGYDLEALTARPGRIMIVGGGVGLAPFPLLLRVLGKCEGSRGAGASVAENAPQLVGAERAGSRGPVVLLGFRDAKQAQGAKWLREVIARVSKTGLRASLEVVTEDGSSGLKGKVTDLVEKHVQPGDRLAVCGPEAMAREIWQICASTNNVKAWFSLEAKMACGVGSCHGCVVALADGSYARVCHEGPVFLGEEIFGG